MLRGGQYPRLLATVHRSAVQPAFWFPNCGCYSEMQASLCLLQTSINVNQALALTSWTWSQWRGHQFEDETREGRKKWNSNLPLKYVSNSSASFPHFHQLLQTSTVISQQDYCADSHLPASTALACHSSSQSWFPVCHEASEALPKPPLPAQLS